MTPDPNRSTRRSLLKAGLLGAAGLAPASLRADDAPAVKPIDAARALLKEQFGDKIAPEALDGAAREVIRNRALGRFLAQTPLDNGDEPDWVFSADGM